MLCAALPFSPLADNAASGTAHTQFVVACGLHDRSAPDCGYGARYLLAGGDLEEGRLHQIGLRAQ